MAKKPTKASASAKASAKAPAKSIDSESIEAQIKDSAARADLYEARARIAIAQTAISRSQLERRKIQSELEAFLAKKK